MDKLSSVSIGDVVAYDELSANGEKSHVMAALGNFELAITRSHKFAPTNSAARDALRRPLATR